MHVCVCVCVTPVCRPKRLKAQQMQLESVCPRDAGLVWVTNVGVCVSYGTGLQGEQMS